MFGHVMTHENAANSQFPFIFQGNDSWSNEWRGSKLCRAVGQWSTLALLESTLRKCMPRDAGSVRSFDENYWSSPASKGPILHLSLECLDFFSHRSTARLALEKASGAFQTHIFSRLPAHWCTWQSCCVKARGKGKGKSKKGKDKARAIKPERSLLRPSSSSLLLRLLLLPAACRSKLEQNLLQNSVAVACGHSAQMCSIDWPTRRAIAHGCDEFGWGQDSREFSCDPAGKCWKCGTVWLSNEKQVMRLLGENAEATSRFRGMTSPRKKPCTYCTIYHART